MYTFELFFYVFIKIKHHLSKIKIPLNGELKMQSES